MGGVEWSTTPPAFELANYVHSANDESDLYGVEHRFSFVSGSTDDVTGFYMGLAQFNVGGMLRNGDGNGVKTEFWAATTFPLHRHANMKGVLATDFTPAYDELEIIAGALMQTLANSQDRRANQQDETMNRSEAL